MNRFAGTASRCMAGSVMAATGVLLSGIAMVLMLAIAAPGQAYAQMGTYVFDETNFLSADDFSNFESQAKELSETYGLGVYLLIDDNMDGMYNTATSRTRYATTYYTDHDLGLNSGKDGIMLVVAYRARAYVTIAYGQGSYSFGDAGIEDMEDKLVDQLGDNHWIAGFQSYFDSMRTQLSYYDRHGRAWDPTRQIVMMVMFVLALVIPLLIAMAVVRAEKKAMLTAVKASEAHWYARRNSMYLSQSNDRFLHTSLSKIPKPEPSSSSGGFGGGGGGGGWGGGGGGGFSSSGGGRF